MQKTKYKRIVTSFGVGNRNSVENDGSGKFIFEVDDESGAVVAFVVTEVVLKDLKKAIDEQLAELSNGYDKVTSTI